MLTPDQAMAGAKAEGDGPLQKAIAIAKTEMAQKDCKCGVCFANLVLKLLPGIRAASKGSA